MLSRRDSGSSLIILDDGDISTDEFTPQPPSLEHKDRSHIYDLTPQRDSGRNSSSIHSKPYLM